MLAYKKSVDDYITAQTTDIQPLLKEIRKTIKKSAPKAEESISYGMPAYKYCGKPLVYFGAYKYHIGFYATPSGHLEFSEELSRYKQGKGSVQFPIDKALPLQLITKIVEFRVQENETLAQFKKKK